MLSLKLKSTQLNSTDASLKLDLKLLSTQLNWGWGWTFA